MDRERFNRNTRNSKYKSYDSSTRGTYHPRRKYKNTFNYPMIAGAVVAVILILIIIIWLVSAVTGAVKPKKEKTAETTTTESVSVSELSKAVMIDNIVITGLSKVQAKDKIMKNYTWDMKAILEGKTEDNT